MSHVHPSRILRLRRGGHTLVELLVSMTAATFLMAGLGSCLMVATRAFDGNFNALTRSRAAEVQEDLIADLHQATSFVTRTADSVSFRVPDRDNDGLGETLAYTWTGLPAAELHYAKNGNAPVTVLENVQDFNLSYMERLLPGTTLPPLAPDEWGRRGALQTFGNDTVYASIGWGQHSTAAVHVTLTESGTLKSISACLATAGSSDVRMGIYDTDWLGNPRNLLASTAAVRVSDPGWQEIPTPPVALTPGSYYLAISIKDTRRVACRYEVNLLGRAYTQGRDSASLGFSPSWGSPGAPQPARVSIYASYSPD